MASILIFIVPFLRARGLNNSQIGLCMGVKYFGSISVQMILSRFMDSRASTIPLKIILLIMIVIDGINIGLLFVKVLPFVVYVVVFLLFGSSLNAMSPFIDSLATQYKGIGVDIKYSIARGMGSLSWAALSIFGGRVIDIFGTESILKLAVIAATLTFIGLVLFTNPDITLLKRKEKKSDDIKSSTVLFLKDNKTFMFFLMSSCLMYISYNLNTLFMVDIVTNLGGNNTDLGLVQGVMSLIAVLTSFFFDKLRKRVRIGWILISVSVFALLRTTASVVAINIPMLVGVQCFNMLGLGMFWIANVYYVMEGIKQQYKMRAQSLISVFTLGLGGIVGSIVSGYVIDRVGLQPVLMGSIATGILAVIFMVVAFYKYKKPEEE